MSAPFVVIVRPDKRNNVKGYRTEHATAIDTEREAARLRSLGWSAYAEEKKRAKKADDRAGARGPL